MGRGRVTRATGSGYGVKVMFLIGPGLGGMEMGWVHFGRPSGGKVRNRFGCSILGVGGGQGVVGWGMVTRV